MDLEEYSKNTHFYSDEIPRILLKYLKKIEWNSYLDLGCGDGSILYALNKNNILNNKSVYAVDISPTRIKNAKTINNNFKCFVSDVCDLKNIEDNSIDVIVSTQVIEHVSNEKLMLNEINRVLTKGGFVYLSTVFKKKYGWYFYRCNGKWVLDPTHIREYTKDDQLLKLLQNNNFDICYSRKYLIHMPVIDFVIRKFGANVNIFDRSRFLRLFRKVRIPILGYYHWVIVFSKN